MAATSQVGVVRAAFKSALATRLSGVAVVHAFEPGPDDITANHLWIQNARSTQEHGSQSTRDDTFDLEVVAFCEKPGDGDTAAAAAENAVLTVQAQVEDYLTDSPTITGSCLHAQLVSYEVENTSSPGNRRATSTMTVRVLTELSPS